MARRVIGALLGLYLIAAVIGRGLEAGGLSRCGCGSDC